MGDDLRAITVTENQQQVTELGIKRLCFGQKMLGPDGKSKINLIWKSQDKDPSTTIQWRVKYALNWTMTLPTPGIVVITKGAWQACNLGESYKINKDGFWQSDTGGRTDYLNITGNDHKLVYPVVGLWDEESKQYLSAYVDPTSLDIGGSSFYQPQTEHDVWYEADVKSSQMIEGNVTRPAKFNTSIKNPKTQEYVWNTTYEPTTGIWTGDNEENAAMLAAVNLSFLRFVVRFDKQVPVTKWLKAKAVVNGVLEKRWGEPVTVKWLTKFLLEIKLKSKDGREIPGETPTEKDIRAAIEAASESGDLAPGETFEIAEIE